MYVGGGLSGCLDEAAQVCAPHTTHTHIFTLYFSQHTHTLTHSPQDDAIRNLFSAQTKAEYSVTALLTFAACFFLLAVISYGE